MGEECARCNSRLATTQPFLGFMRRFLLLYLGGEGVGGTFMSKRFEGQKELDGRYSQDGL